MGELVYKKEENKIVFVDEKGEHEVYSPLRMDGDFRTKGSGHLREILKEGGKELLNRYTFSGLPPDRKGLIAVFHPLMEYTGEFLGHMHEVMKLIAMYKKRTVFFVMDDQKWRLVLFGYVITDPKILEEDFGLEPGITRIWYDQYANDQFISHYDPDGSYHVDGVS